MLRESNGFTGNADSLSPIGQRTDREAAHYYRSMHARAVEREQYWKHRASAGEQIIKQLLLLVGMLLQQLEDIKGRLAWLNKQLFGSKSEATGPQAGAAAESDPAGQSPVDSQPNPTQGKRRRGQQKGAKGPKRQRRLNLPEETIHHTLSQAELTCPVCGQLASDTGLREESEQVGWTVCLRRERHVRHRYRPGCTCRGRGLRTAPKPAKLIPKGLFGVSFWVQVLLKKFAFQQPLQRIVRELEGYDLKVSPGTLTGGLQKLQPLIQTLAGQFVLRARQGNHWHMDETGWPMWVYLPDGNRRERWWAWVVVGRDATAFLFEPSRSGKVPQNFFAKGTEGILNSDRFRAYLGLLGSDWNIQLAYCWSHQRRDFVNLGEGCRRLAGWAEQWIGLINQLFAINRQRRQAWSGKQTELFNALDQELRRQVQELGERVDRELASGKLARQQEKVLQSMRRHWAALTVFVDHPDVPMDNNAAERALRPLAVARKNFYGSGSKWSGELACGSFTILATLQQHGICPRRFLQEYLEACARHGGKAPENLDPFLPWKWSAEKRAAWSTQEHPP